MIATFLLAATFSGTVVLHHRTGAEEAVAAAVVDVSRSYPSAQVATGVTAVDGTFSIPDVEPGHYSLAVTANAGRMSGEITVPANENEPSRTVYLFEPTCEARFGRVRDLVTGEPIAGAEVSYLGRAITDANGDYFINLGCFAGPGFGFHNSFFYGASAKGYRRIEIFGGRAEYAGGGMSDVDMQPVGARPGEHGRD